MDWIRQNNFLATFGGIMIVGVLGLGYFAFSSWKGYSAALDEFDNKRSSLESLENKKLHPDPDNLGKVTVQADEFEKAVDGLFGKLKAAQVPLPAETEVDSTKFGAKIKEKLLPFDEKAKELDIRVVDTFYLGMERYRTNQADSDPKVLQRLEWQLGGIAELANVALEAGIESIDQFHRYIDPWEDPSVAKPAEKKKPARRGSRASRDTPKKAKLPAGPKMADVLEPARVRLRITGRPAAIAKFFNLVSNNQNYFFWTRWAVLANESPVGPSASIQFVPRPVEVNVGPAVPGVNEDSAAPAPVVGGEVPDAPAAAVEEVFEPGAGAMIDVFPILGAERVRADVVIDIIRFRDPPSADDNPAKK